MAGCPSDAARVGSVGPLLAVRDIHVAREDRIVGRDNTVRYAGLELQIPESRHRHHDVKARVCVHAQEDGRLSVFHGPRCLARYDASGQLQEAVADGTRSAA